jgi:tripartite-type tricarboxylate transporter receptor subunit TctC
MKNLTKILASLSLAGFALAASAQQTYPNKPIRLIVPLAAGGGTDLAARVVAQALGDRIGQSVVIENRAGAGGVIGVEAASKAAPDGYTFVIGSSTTMAANVFLYKNLPFDPLKDFVPLAMMGTIDFALVVPASLPAGTLKEFIGLAKAKPGQLSYGFGSSAALLCGEMFKSVAGVDIVKVPYKGTPQSLTDLAADRIQLVCEPFGTSLPFIKAGKLRPLAVTNTARNGLAPEVPTMAEAGLPMVHVTWAAFFAPAKTPADALAKLRTELLATMKATGIPERIRDTGFVPTPADHESLGVTHRADIARLEKLVKDAGIKAE